MLTEPFLEAGFGRLLEDVPFDDLLHRLIVSNMTVRDVQGLRYVLERARGGRGRLPPRRLRLTGRGLPNP